MLNTKKISIALSVLLILAAVSILAACSHKQNIPDWVKSSKSPKTYKAIEYMVGISQGADLTKAKDNARAEIAKQFSVKIEQLLQVMQQYTGMDGNKDNNWILKTKISDLTRTYTDQTVAGIKIVETFVNEKTGDAFAIAVLRRSPAVMRLQARVIDLDDEIQHRFTQSKQTTDILQKIRPLVQALEQLKEREIMNNQLMVVNYAGVGIEPEITAGQLNDALNDTLGKLQIAVKIDGDDEGKIRNAIVESLNNGKISVQAETEGCDILISGTLKLEQTNKKTNTNYTFAKITVDLTMENMLDKRTFGKVEHSLRDGAIGWEDAKSKTMTKLVGQITQKFNEKFYEFLSL